MKSLARIAFGAAALFVSPIAHAQSPAPIGVWQGLNSGDYLVIQRTAAARRAAP
jgi:hypothetical protein